MMLGLRGPMYLITEGLLLWL